MERVGIIGGTFDPVHRGHLRLAIDAKEQANLSKVVFMPNHLQPFKDQAGAEAKHRLDMLKISIRELGVEGLCISEWEINRKQISYTCEMLDAMKESMPDKAIYFIVGTDAFLSVPGWKDGMQLLKHSKFIVGSRPGWREAELNENVEQFRKLFSSEILLIENKRLDISATEIRNRLTKGLAINHLVMDGVEGYIKKNGLYREG